MNKFINTKKAIEYGNVSWSNAAEHGLIGISGRYISNNKIITPQDHEFINMVSCSYLGLDIHPKIIECAIKRIEKEKTLNVATSRLRIHLSCLNDIEENISDLFNAECILTTSCGAASSGVLPVLASGYLTNNIKPVMIFDKNAHFSMNHIKPICGDETSVVTCLHNDLNFIEDVCKQNQQVAYIADGAYSMGGETPIDDLLLLQQKYGLFLYIDDSHSLSVCGKNGEGLIKSKVGILNDKTIIVASLGKGFGANGGVIMLDSKKYRNYIERFGGPIAWSQWVSTATMGAIEGSIDIHRSKELNKLQAKLKENVAVFDQHIVTNYSNTNLPIRLVPVGEAEKAIEYSKFVYQNGFYTSAVFFPIVARGNAGLRVMPRASLTKEDMQNFCNTIENAKKEIG